ncbi:hypothetical protein YPPY03_0995, partial [Yersinia pestis PY-03]
MFNYANQFYFPYIFWRIK